MTKHVPCCTCQDCKDDKIDCLIVENEELKLRKNETVLMYEYLQTELKTKNEKIKSLYKLLADYGYMGE